MGRRNSSFRIVGQAVHDEIVDGGGDIGAMSGWWQRLPAPFRIDDRQRVVGKAERWCAGQHFEHDGAGGIEIDEDGDWRSPLHVELLRSHIGRCADDAAFRRHRLPAEGVSCDSEIGNAEHTVSSDEQVVRFDIAMNNPVAVRCIEAEE